MILRGICVHFSSLVILSSFTSGYYYPNPSTLTFLEKELIAPTPASRDLYNKIQVTAPSYSWGFPPTTANTQYTHPSYGFGTIQAYRKKKQENDFDKQKSQSEFKSAVTIDYNKSKTKNVHLSSEDKDLYSNRDELVEQYKEQFLNNILRNKFGEANNKYTKMRVGNVYNKLNEREEFRRQSDRGHLEDDNNGKKEENLDTKYDISERMLYVSPDFDSGNDLKTKIAFNPNKMKHDIPNDSENPAHKPESKYISFTDRQENQTIRRNNAENSNLAKCKEHKPNHGADNMAVAGGLRCYSCDNLTSASCQRITEYSNETTCSDREDRCLIILTRNIFTDKLTMRRSCGQKNTCQKLDSVATEIRKCYSCKSDLCNGSAHSRISFTVFLILAIISIYASM